MKLKNKIWIIAMIILVLIISGCNPTGRAVQDTEEDLEEAGKYAVRPSFETEINYDFSDYEKIKQGIQFLKEKCIDEKEEDIEKCILSKTAKLFSMTGIMWGLGSCDTGEKAFFYSFVKAYEECFFSLDDDCVCKGEPYKGDLTSEIKLSFSGTGALILTSGTFERELPGKLSYVKGEYIFDPQALDWEFEIEKGEIKESNINPEHGIYDKSIFPLYKHDSVVSLIAAKPGLDIDEKKECKITQDHFQFCLLNSQRKYPKIVDGKFREEPVMYKFAVIFEDTVPPPKIFDLAVSDKVKAEKSLILSWSKSEAKDTNHYNVYLSDETFDNVAKATNIFDVTSGDEKIEADISVAEDDKTYYFAVTAVDNNGNELEDVGAKTGVSVDDLSPAKPAVIYEIKDNNIEFKIKLPTENEDGSEISADEELTVLIRKLFGESDCSIEKVLPVAEGEIGKGKKAEEIEHSIAYEKGCYGFVVKDQKGNPKDDASLKKLLEIKEIP